jgi:hypothetical protein
MSSADQFEALALNGWLRHGDHSVLSWCASNAVVTKDAAGNRKLDRSRATGRIDGLVAAVMAVAAMSGAPEPRAVISNVHSVRRGARTVAGWRWAGRRLLWFSPGPPHSGLSGSGSGQCGRGLASIMGTIRSGHRPKARR